jgi:hypothetical protein
LKNRWWFSRDTFHNDRIRKERFVTNVEWTRRVQRILGAGAFTIVVTLATTGAGQQSGANANQDDDFSVDPARGPVDLGLTDPALVGAIDLHVHMDPDSIGVGNAVRSLDVFEYAKLAQARGLRGFAYKNHLDHMGAGAAYLVRKYIAPDLEVFGRMPSNMSTGGINVASLEHFSQIKGGWGRIFEMPTRDSETSTRNEAQGSRPWILLRAPDAPKFVAVSRNGALLPEVKHLIEVMAKIRTVDSGGRMVLATGHASPEEHLMIAREGREHGLQVMLTHPGDIPQLPEAAKLGAFIEVNASGIYPNAAGARAAAALIRKIGAESLVMGTDCGQMRTPYPTDCLVLAVRRLRAQGITDRELKLMMKDNPAKLLGLVPFEQTQPRAFRNIR